MSPVRKTYNMAKIICITSGLTGILNASFELVNRLQADGHELLYASPKEVGKYVEKQGIAYFQLPQILTQTTPKLPSFKGPFRKISRWVYKIKNAKQLQRKALENIEPQVFSTLVKSEKPDLLLIDVELHEYILKSFNQDIPLVLLSQWFSLWKRPGLPYLLKDTIPGEGWKGQQWAIELSWKIIRFKRWWTFFKQKIYTVGTDRRSLLLDFAKKENFPLKYLRENNWPGPFTYDQLPVISMTSEDLEFPNDTRPSLYYVGPMIAENRKDLVVKEEVNLKLDKIFKIKRNTNARLIYCSVSTLHPGDHLFIKKVIKAVESRKGYLLIVGLGGLIETTEFKTLPSNVFAFPYIPQLKVLKEADCSINHGGIHTINECIHFKVPMLIYSGKRSDQNGCAARIAFHKLGVMADKDKDSISDIGLRIDKILEDESYRKNVEKIHQAYLQNKTDKKLEYTIKKFLLPEIEEEKQKKIAI